MQKITKAVIPVAGMGTRFLPITKSIPKEMLPIIDKPTLAYIIDEAVNSGITDFLLITSPYKKVIEDYFDNHYELEKRMAEKNKNEQIEILKNTIPKVHIYYIRQGEPLGSGHAIKLAKAFVGQEPFAVLYGDDIMKSDIPALKQLINLYNQTGSNIIGCMEVSNELVSNYGMLELSDSKKVIDIIEKPNIEETPSNWAGLGRYIVNHDIFDILETLSKGANNEYQFTDAMRILMKSQDFYACKLDAIYYDTGSKIGYLKANIDYALEREDLNTNLTNYLCKKIKK